MHLLVSWGLFRRDGPFLPVEGIPEPETVGWLFRYRVVRMLLAEGAIEEGVVRNSPDVAPYWVRHAPEPWDPGGREDPGGRHPL